MLSEATQKRPWTFVPLLYFMQAVPYALVTEVSVVFLKDFGIENRDITFWTSIAAIAWSIKFLWGPLVELNFTRRQWVVTLQGCLTASLLALPFAFHTPNPFVVSLALLFTTAMFSATCDIATDGFYLLALRKDEQAAYVGVQSTCFRLGRLFCNGVLVFAAGALHSNGMDVASSWGWVIGLGAAYYGVGWLAVGFNFGEPGFGRFSPRAGIESLRWTLRGLALAGIIAGLYLSLPSLYQILVHAFRWVASALGSGNSQSDSGPAYSMEWVRLLFGGIGALVCLALFTGRSNLPRPDADLRAVNDIPGDNLKNVFRIALVVVGAVLLYFTANSLVRLGAFGLWTALDGNHVAASASGPGHDLHGWYLTSTQVGQEIVQLLLCAVGSSLAFVFVRRLVRGTQVGDAFTSFIRQNGIWAILAFIMFYRFGEAMVLKMAPLFLKDAPGKGGLGIPNELLGQINGVGGPLGLVAGGLLGGFVVSRFGLRRSFWPLAILMHLPNLLYLWATYAKPDIPAIYGIVFVDQFGYGFGFAAYLVYLMQVAQRGSYKTSHYAICTGLGAMFISVAGILSGIVQANYGYQTFFLVVIFATVPGMLTLLAIPLDRAMPSSA